MLTSDGTALRTMSEWIAVWKREHRIELNINTTRARRKVAKVGSFVPPSTYLLTRKEFEAVLHTPLPGCHEGAKAVRG